MEQMSRHGMVGMAAMRAGMDRSTAARYLDAGKLPSELASGRTWRTREDPFAEHRAEIEALMRDSPALEVKTLFEVLCRAHPGVFEPGQLRTLQRLVRVWRATQGPDQEVVLAQRHRPGEAAQTDFTSTPELGITIAGAAFVHLLCLVVLPFSNWLWATVCLSESMAALRRGVQRALFQLGRVPRYHQTDHSTGATHQIGKAAGTTARAFNDDYLALMRHYGMTPRTTAVGAKEQNGDVEAANGAHKRRIEQALLVRGHRDFASVEAYQAFLDEVGRKANQGRGTRLAEEIDAMRVLAVGKLPEFVTLDARVSEWSTIRVKGCAYSVPARLIGEVLQVRLYEDRLEASYRGQAQLACERLRGRHRHHIDYRHVIWSLVQKPGGFARYVYREEMFPTLTFRRAYDALQARLEGTRGDLAYLRILHLAASTLEADVETALGLLLAEPRAFDVEAVKALVLLETRPSIPEMAPLTVDLRAYDALLAEVGT